MAKELTFKHPDFEYEVRKRLGIYDRPITIEDVLEITYLDLFDFDFAFEDNENLSLFSNLNKLNTYTSSCGLEYLRNLNKLKNLYLEYGSSSTFDFSKIEHLKNLEEFFISGGDYSDVELINIDALLSLPKLKHLSLHEFGSIDFSPLRQMSQLESFCCGFANEIRNINALKYLTNLKHLELIEIEVDSLDFLDNFPDDMEIELCLNVCGNADFAKLKRFTNSDIYEMRLNGKYI